jgi:oligopeptidase B
MADQIEDVPSRILPPVAERRPTRLVVHGDERIDDYYWLSNREDPEVLALLEAENAYTAATTTALAGLEEEIFNEIVAHTLLSETSVPAPKGRFAYYERTVEGLDYKIHCRRAVDAPPPPSLVGDPPTSAETAGAPGAVSGEDLFEQVVLDENLEAVGHGFFELGGAEVSPDQSLLAYLVDTEGGEHFSLRLRDLEAGSDLDEIVEDVDYGLAWSQAGDTVFYTRADHAKRPFQCWRHRLRSDPSTDTLCYEEPDERFFVAVSATKDNRFIVLQLQSNLTSEVRLLDAGDPEGEFFVVEPHRQGVEYHVEHHEGQLLILTNDRGAENFSLMTAPRDRCGAEHWSELVGHRSDVRLEGLEVVKGYAILATRGGASTALEVVDLGSGAISRIEPPDEAGTISLGDNLEFTSHKIRYEATSLVVPRGTYEFDLESATTTLLHRTVVPGGYDPHRYRTERLYASAEDGTDVPITIAYLADRDRSRPGPLLLYGYGAYEASTDPVFSARRLPLLERGAAYAIAHVRGGGELGRQWYLDGKLRAKHHSFSDFVAVAEHLVAEGWTERGQLAARGGSAGGLLMGAVANLAPDLFAAIVAMVPFVDCVTTMLDDSLPLTVTEWEEWGNPGASKEDYAAMLAYSPYDNIRPVPYPAMLVTGGLNDPRVSYFEPAKWVQKLRAAHKDNVSRILLRMEMGAGHFGPSGRYTEWRREAFILAFVLNAITSH